MAVNLKQNADGTLDFQGEQLGKSLMRLGGSEQPTTGAGGGAGGGAVGGNVAGGTIAYHNSSYIKAILGSASLTAGVLSILNPYPNDVMVGQVLVNVTAGFGVASTATLSMGTGTYSTTFGNNLLDALTCVAAGLYDNTTDKGTNGKSRQLWANGTYITMTAGQTPNTLAGYVYIEVINP